MTWPRVWAAPPPTRPHPFTNTAGLVIGGACYYCGFVVLETGGVTAATVNVFDGLAATGILIDAGKAAISGVDRGGLNQAAIFCERGLFVTVAGSLAFQLVLFATPVIRNVTVGDNEIADLLGSFPT